MNERANDAPFDDEDDASFQHLGVSVDDGIAVVTIDRPDALNALNGELLLELTTAFDLIEADVGVRALVITGAGRAFVAGADVAELAPSTTRSPAARRRSAGRTS
jgi:enoyl-CoA hydratase/carnithine racemase